MRIVIDHVSGSRRGQRQELPGEGRVRFGRHPECEVSFDAHRDIDASSRHAELRQHGDRWILVDVGSSNGTYVDGKRITEAPVSPGVPVMVDFGPSGPKLRLFIGDDEQVVRLAAPPLEPAPSRRTWVLAVLVALGVAAGAAVLALAL